jgi:hypothetical protein
MQVSIAQELKMKRTLSHGELISSSSSSGPSEDSSAGSWPAAPIVGSGAVPALALPQRRAGEAAALQGVASARFSPRLDRQASNGSDTIRDGTRAPAPSSARSGSAGGSLGPPHSARQAAPPAAAAAAGFSYLAPGAGLAPAAARRAMQAAAASTPFGGHQQQQEEEDPFGNDNPFGEPAAFPAAFAAAPRPASLDGDGSDEDAEWLRAEAAAAAAAPAAARGAAAVPAPASPGGAGASDAAWRAAHLREMAALQLLQDSAGLPRINTKSIRGTRASSRAHSNASIPHVGGGGSGSAVAAGATGGSGRRTLSQALDLDSLHLSPISSAAREYQCVEFGAPQLVNGSFEVPMVLTQTVVGAWRGGGRGAPLAMPAAAGRGATVRMILPGCAGSGAAVSRPLSPGAPPAAQVPQQQ